MLKEHLVTDPEFRAEWERTALARAVAIAVVRYRGEHALSQRALAQRLGVRQPAVARLELGEHTPSIETLGRLAGALGMEFLLHVTPADRLPHWSDPLPTDGVVVARIEGERSAVTAAVR